MSSEKNPVETDDDKATDPPPIHLVVQVEIDDKPAREFTYDFEQSVITMGRDPSNDIQVPLTTVSRQHARIFYELSDYFFEDLSSTHGSKHNGRALEKGEKRLLRDGDLIAIMAFSITFRTKSASKFDRKPGEKTLHLTRRMVEEVLASLGSSEGNTPVLRIMTAPDEGKRVELSEGQTEFILGRSPECDIPLRDQNASRRHCLIKRDWHGFSAQDLGSRNGVSVNGKTINGSKNLRDGDEILVGNTRLTFIDPASRLLDQMDGVPGPTDDLQEEENDGENKDIPEEAEDEQDADGDEDFDDDDFEDSDGKGKKVPDPVEPPEVAEEKKPRKFRIQAEMVILALGALGLLLAAGLIIFLII